MRSLLVIALLMLAGCASYSGRGLVPGVSTAAEVDAVMGPAAERRAGPNGETVLWYPRLPYGRESYAARIGADGKLIAIEQRLTEDNLGYLEHAGEQIHTLLQREPRKVLFVPFAGVTFSFDTYEGMVKPVFEKLGYALESIHHSADPLRAVQEAEAIAVGGGNTFALLKRMYDAGIVEAIRAKVRAGTPYVGWSAGSNVACVSGCSTSTAVTRPRMRSRSDSMTSPPSISARMAMPCCVPQSSSMTTRSCVTSTNRRVR